MKRTEKVQKPLLKWREDNNGGGMNTRKNNLQI